MSSPKVKTLTKEELRNALIMNGVSVPPAAAKKEEFQKLYDEKVLPLLTRSEFSSDDEQDAAPVSNGTENGISREERAKKQEWEEYVKGLSNEELYSQLMRVGFSGGPVVASTRLLYEAQLMSKIGHPLIVLNKQSTNGFLDREGDGQAEKLDSPIGFSDSDDDATVETASRASRSSRGSNAALRKRGRPAAGTPKREAAAGSSRSQETNSPPQTPTRSRLQRRSETPRTLGSASRTSISGPPDAIRSTEREELRRIEMRNSMFSVESGISSGVSYFKERPGYASTTTSNVLPLKPTAPMRNRSTPFTYEEEEDEPAPANEKKGSNMWFTFLTLFFAIAVALVAVYIFTVWTDGGDAVPDELDQLLETMENP